MSKGGEIRFRRVRGRIIPIRDRIHLTGQAAVAAGAAASAASLYSLHKHLTTATKAFSAAVNAKKLGGPIGQVSYNSAKTLARSAMKSGIRAGKFGQLGAALALGGALAMHYSKKKVKNTSGY